jgi:hypothetical protein
MKIALHSVYRTTDPGAPSRIEFLRECAAADTLKKHTLVDNPADADAVLITEAWTHYDRVFFSKIRNASILEKYRRVSFVYCDSETTVNLLPGLYPCIDKNSLRKGWHLSSPYITPVMREFEAVADREPICLYSFQGSMVKHRVRRKLRDLPNHLGCIRDVSREWAISSGTSGQRLREQYIDGMLESKFVLCPRGKGVSSFRLFEAMALGRVPVIISDGWVEPPGPVWNRCSIRVPERAVKDIPSILQRAEPTWRLMALEARSAYRAHFASVSIFHWIGEQIQSLLSGNPVPATARNLMFSTAGALEEEAKYLAAAVVSSVKGLFVKAA